MIQKEICLRGQGLIEYSLILVMVIIVVIIILNIMGPSIGEVFSDIISTI